MTDEDLRKMAKTEQYDDIIFIGIKNSDMTMVSSCPTPEETAVVLEVATTNAFKELFPYLPASRRMH